MGTRFPEDPRAPVASGAEGEGVVKRYTLAFAPAEDDGPPWVSIAPDPDGDLVYFADVAALAPRRAAPAELGEGCTCDGSPWCTVHPVAPAEPTASTAGEGADEWSALRRLNDGSTVGNEVVSILLATAQGQKLRGLEPREARWLAAALAPRRVAPAEPTASTAGEGVSDV
jgi:hypothetical protein